MWCCASEMALRILCELNRFYWHNARVCVLKNTSVPEVPHVESSGKVFEQETLPVIFWALLATKTRSVGTLCSSKNRNTIRNTLAKWDAQALETVKLLFCPKTVFLLFEVHFLADLDQILPQDRKVETSSSKNMNDRVLFLYFVYFHCSEVPRVPRCPTLPYMA